MNVIAYQRAALQCSGFGSPDPTVEWFKDGQRLIITERIEIVGDQLIINNLQGSDAGTYFCELTTEAIGRVRSRTATLEIAGE